MPRRRLPLAGCRLVAKSIWILFTAVLLAGIPFIVGSSEAEAAADPATTAVDVSVLESQGRFSEIYDQMHPDAQAIIPREAVVGWYEHDFAPIGPGVITVTGVQYVKWTWPVTGKTYPHTAEVSFTQPFSNGAVTSGVVRLVESGGSWHWFFGRSKAFVEEQISKYAPAGVPAAPGSNGSCAGAAEWWKATVPNIAAANYLGNSLTSMVNSRNIDQGSLNEFATAFRQLYLYQDSLVSPAEASTLERDFLDLLELYQRLAQDVAALASGQMNPMAQSGAMSAVVEGSEKIGNIGINLPSQEAQFIATCEPLVVFVYGMGEDLPIGVLPGEVGPEIPRVDCTLFASPEEAQRFLEASGSVADPHGLDGDGDGVACEPGEGGLAPVPTASAVSQTSLFSVATWYCDSTGCVPVAGIRVTYQSQDGSISGSCTTEYIEGPNGTLAGCDYRYIRGMPTTLRLEPATVPTGMIITSENPQTYLVPEHPDGELGPVYFELGPA